MNVLCDVWSLESCIVSENVLLTCLTCLSRNLLFYCVAVAKFYRLKSLDVSRESSDSCICYRICESLEIWSS